MSAPNAAGSPRAFLSYTRIDDEAFGGAITSLRRLLELRVQVVTGNRKFAIFQDVEGIELGQKWQKRLDEAISSSMFLIPIVTPLFFTSDPCRDELTKFISHEKALGRDDLILPIYFVTTPNLEKDEERQRDSLAQEIASRQIYDWRDEADLPLDDPEIRKAIRNLSEGVATALDRSAGPHFVGDEPTDEVSDLVRTLESARAQPKNRRLVLWVDDKPDNNILEREAMAAYNIDFVLARSTGQALALAVTANQQFDVIISDMGRPPDSRAGYTLLEALRESGNRTPYFIYAGSRAAEHTREALQRGAQGNTNRSDELIHMVLQTLER
jgi:CheY-like chemotaxis protein